MYILAIGILQHSAVPELLKADPIGRRVQKAHPRTVAGTGVFITGIGKLNRTHR